MKYAKMIGLLAVAAAAMMAFAASASATGVTAPAGTLYTSTIDASSEGATQLHAATTVTCQTSSVKGKVEQHGAGVTAGGKISSLTFGECGTSKVSVKNSGSLEIHGNGTLTSSGAEVEIQMSTIFGTITCVFTTNNTDIGTLTNAPSASGHATLDLDSASIPRTGGSSLCGSAGEWTGSYKVNTPTGLTIHS